MKKALKISVCTLLCSFLVLGITTYLLINKQYSAAKSVQEIGKGMYSFTYEGDYGFDEFIENGGAKNTDEVAKFVSRHLTHGLFKANVQPQEFGCSFICAQDKEGNSLTGRNFDWPNCTSDIVVVHTKPDNGFASISTNCINFLGFPKDYKPTQDIPNRMKLLATIYAPLDGMNEKGLCVANLVAGDKDTTSQSNATKDLTISTAIRLLLDHASTTDEAVKLLSEYNMHEETGFNHHLAVSDANGKSIVVEWINGDMHVAESSLCTNHYIADSYKKGKSMHYEDSHKRFDIMNKEMTEHPYMEALDVTKSIQLVATPKLTRWSIVYDQKELKATYYQNADFTKPYEISLQ